MTNKEILKNLVSGNTDALKAIQNRKPVDYPLLKKYGIQYGQITIFHETDKGRFVFNSLKGERIISESERKKIVDSNEGMMFVTTHISDGISDTLR
ncbi:MAG: hypothetical protein P1U70_27345 [Saprospiraceae bacterium]|jgi:phage-related protein|nr:hypothetical protein [Saprospiraceae bacterium]